MAYLRTTLEAGLFYRDAALDMLRRYCWNHKLKLEITTISSGFFESEYGIYIEGSVDDIKRARTFLLAMEQEAAE